MSLESLIADHPTLNATVADTEPEYIEAELNYIKPQSDKPHNYTYKPAAGKPRQSTVNKARRLKIRNGRSLVSNIPVAMPTVVSVTMAVGAQELAKKQAIASTVSLESYMMAFNDCFYFVGFAL